MLHAMPVVRHFVGMVRKLVQEADTVGIGMAGPNTVVGLTVLQKEG